MSFTGRIPGTELSGLLEAAWRNGVEVVDVRLDGQSLALSVPDGNEHYGRVVTVDLATNSTGKDS